MNVKNSFIYLLRNHGYSEKTIKSLWTWYDYSELKGVASF